MKTTTYFIIFSMTLNLLYSQHSEFQTDVIVDEHSVIIQDANLQINDSVGATKESMIIYNQNGDLKFQNSIIQPLNIKKTGDVQFNTSVLNKSAWENSTSTLGFSDLDPNAGTFVLGSKELMSDGSGIAGNGSHIAFWSPGDAHGGVSAYAIFLDEDLMHDGDTDPYNNGAIKLYLNTAGVWTVSDMNKKENIRKLDDGLSVVQKLKPFRYSLKINDTEMRKDAEPLVSSGFMAQDLESIIPEAVSQTTHGDYYVNYNMLAPYVVKAIQEQQEKIDHLTQENNSLKERQQQLELRLKKIEGQVLMSSKKTMKIQNE